MKSFEISARTVSSTNSLPELVTDENTLNMGVDYALTDKQVVEVITSKQTPGVTGFFAFQGSLHNIFHNMIATAPKGQHQQQVRP